VLEYGPTEQGWNCNQAQFEEKMTRLDEYSHHNMYKELMWILGLPKVRRLPSAGDIPAHSTFADSKDKLTIYNRWYELVEGYSARQLTFETDKLPAITSLAHKIHGFTEDVYMAGLWKKDLGAGLCWKRRGSGDLHRSSQYRCPTWSWASVEGSIMYGIPDNHLLAAELVEYDIQTERNNPFGEVFSGRITLLAPLRTLRIRQGTVCARSLEYDEEVGDHTRELEHDERDEVFGLDGQRLYALRDQNNIVDPRGTGICSVCFDFGIPDALDDVILLQLLDAGFEPVPKKHDENFAAHEIKLKI
jgi:hypothetical protein